VYPEGTSVIKKRHTYIAEDPSVPKIAEIILIDTPFENNLISFANGIMTKDGGVHLNAAVRAISDILIKELKDYKNMNKKKPSKGKNGKDTAPKGQKFPLNINDIKANLSMILNCFVSDPSFNSQSKTQLTEPEPDIKLSPEQLEPIKKWKLFERLVILLDQKHELKLAKQTDGSRKRYDGNIDYDHANYEGELGSECILILVEGKSAQGYATVAREMVIPPGSKYTGLDLVGIYPLRGKLMNVMNKKFETICKSEIITGIKSALGLTEGTDYTVKENFKTLKYGQVMILTDADDDGYHIKGLVYLYFKERFPSLFKVPNFFREINLPRLRLETNEGTYSFINNREYMKFIDRHPEYKDLKPDYFKGLGSSSTEDAERDWKDPKYSYMVLDDPDGIKAMTLAFNKKLSDQRKDWLHQYRPVDITYGPTKKMSEFINYEFIEFSIADNVRSIPRFMDGMKNVMGKVVWGALKWGAKKDRTVGAFITHVMELTNYHHGPTALEKTIVGMAQDFVGANNLKYFVNKGIFGTRKKNGKDAAASRYVKTKPEWWLQYIFRQEDMPLLELNVDQNQQVEPKTFYPILPIILINGVIGIGTGWSVTIPNHDPIDVINWYKTKIRGEKPTNIYPWYKGFRGQIVIYDKVKGLKTVVKSDRSIKLILPRNASDDTDQEDAFEENDALNKDDSNQDEEDTDGEEEEIPPSMRPGARGTVTMISKGVYVDDGKKIHIKELPIGVWTEPYEQKLEKMAAEKVIRGYRKIAPKGLRYSDYPEIEIMGMKDANERVLQMSKSYGISNIVLLDENNLPVRYDSILHVMEAFYTARLKIYYRRKDYQLNALKDKINNLNLKLKFVLCVNDGTLVIKRSEKLVHPDMLKLGLPKELLHKIRSHSFTDEGIEELRKKIANTQADYDKLFNTRPEDIWLSEIEKFEAMYRKNELPEINRINRLLGIDRKY
jgi:hypothetical protein